MGDTAEGELPNANSPDLHLTQPTPNESIKIWVETAASWKDSLTLPAYLEESGFLTTVPLAKDGGMTTWILVDKNLPLDSRPILCSCESFRKQSLISLADGKIEEVIVHGIASVSCPPRYRYRGYAARHMAELAQALRTWQSDLGTVAGSVLYSDIGKTYYKRLGWQPNASNWHVEISALAGSRPSYVQQLVEDDLAELCRRDEAIVRKAMATPTEGVRKRVTILTDLDHMLWHIRKEDFAALQLFGKVPQAKGAIAGMPGSSVWAIWTHRYYGHPDVETSSNVLYILRLVVEGDDSANKPQSKTEDGSSAMFTMQDKRVEHLIAVLRAAQIEAAEWQLDQVKLWEPSPWVSSVIKQSPIDHHVVEREGESIASGMWYDKNGGLEKAPVWINNEHYAWC